MRINMQKLEDLDNKNLLTLFDTAREISSELELENEDTITIKTEQDLVEANLQPYLPNSGYEAIAELKRLRQKALKYLQIHNIIINYEFGNNEQNIIITIDQEKFSEFYKNITRIYEGRYEAKNKIISLFDFEKEKKLIKGIKSGTQHRVFRDKWLNTKRVFDTIEDALLYLPVNPIGGDPIIQKITVEKNDFFEKNIPSKKEDIIYKILSLLENSKIIKINKASVLEDEIYITRDPKGIFYNYRASIIVENKDVFDKNLTALSAFVNYIEEDGKKRFPSEYGATRSISEPRKFDYRDSGFDHNLIRSDKIPMEEHLLEIKELIKEGKNKEEIRATKKCLIKTPAGTRWSDLNIRWINGNDVEITLNNSKDFKEIKDFKELGFYDEKRKCPNILWKILSNASYYGGKMSWSELGGTSESERHKKIDNFQKQISLLRNKLRDIFGNLEGGKNEPFVSYSKDKEYIITINLISEKNRKEQVKESWRDLMSEAELNSYDQMAKTDFIKNPNQLPSEDDTY